MGNTVVRRAGAVFAVSGLILIGSATTSFADVGKDQAGTIVTDKYGGQVISVESDTEKGEATWEVEVKDSNRGRIEVDVSKSSGKIVAFETEDDSGEQHSDGTDTQDNSDPGDAKGGATDGGDQVSPKPSGGAATGGGGTAGVEHEGALFAGAGLAMAGGAGLVLLRRRTGNAG